MFCVNGVFAEFNLTYDRTIRSNYTNYKHSIGEKVLKSAIKMEVDADKNVESRGGATVPVPAGGLTAVSSGSPPVTNKFITVTVGVFGNNTRNICNPAYIQTILEQCQMVSRNKELLPISLCS